MDNIICYWNGEDCTFSSCMVGIEGDGICVKLFIPRQKRQASKISTLNCHLRWSFSEWNHVPKNSINKKSSHVVIKDIEAI